MGERPPAGMPTPRADRTVRWSWLLLALYWSWMMLGGGIAYVVTSAFGGEFASGTDVPDFVYKVLYFWLVAPMVASVAVGVTAWMRRRRWAALIPASISALFAMVVTVFGFEEFWG